MIKEWYIGGQMADQYSCKFDDTETNKISTWHKLIKKIISKKRVLISTLKKKIFFWHFYKFTIREKNMLSRVLNDTKINKYYIC